MSTTMAKSNQTIPEIQSQDGILGDLLTKGTAPSSPVTLPNNQDLWTESQGSKPTVLPEVDPRGVAFAYLSRKTGPLFLGTPLSSVPGNPTVLLDPDHPGQRCFPSVTRPHGHRTSKMPVYSIPISSTMLYHHVQRAIKEYEDNVPLENFNEDNDLYNFVREVVNQVINIQRAASCSSVPPFPPKATVLSHVDRPDGIFADPWTKVSTPSIPLKATVLSDPNNRDKKRQKATPIDPADNKEPDQEIDSYPKNFAVEDYPHPKDQNSACYLDFNEDHYLYPAALASVNLALEDYNKQTELIYELVEIVKLSATGLGGLLYHITFKAMSPQKELTTFEAEVFDRISKKDVLRVGIRKPGSEWFDGKLYMRNFPR